MSFRMGSYIAAIVERIRGASEIECEADIYPYEPPSVRSNSRIDSATVGNAAAERSRRLTGAGYQPVGDCSSVGGVMTSFVQRKPNAE